jgi:hypothetical protein
VILTGTVGFIYVVNDHGDAEMTSNAIFLIGRALRYIFAGPSELGKIGADGYKEFKRLD